MRWLLVRLHRPAWAELAVRVGEAACASNAHLQLIQHRGSFCAMALARTWCFEDGRALKAPGTHVPKKYSRRCWGPLEEPGRRRTQWTDPKRACWRHIGDVTRILRKKRRNKGPNATNILVPNLPDVQARPRVAMDRRRWSVALLMTEVQGATGRGPHQVTKEPQRVERSGAISLMAERMILPFHAQDLPERGAWSRCTLKRNFTWQIAQAQSKRSVEQCLRKGLQVRKAA